MATDKKLGLWARRILLLVAVVALLVTAAFGRRILLWLSPSLAVKCRLTCGPVTGLTGSARGTMTSYSFDRLGHSDVDPWGTKLVIKRDGSPASLGPNRRFDGWKGDDLAPSRGHWSLRLLEHMNELATWSLGVLLYLQICLWLFQGRERQLPPATLSGAVLAAFAYWSVMYYGNELIGDDGLEVVRELSFIGLRGPALGGALTCFCLAFAVVHGSSRRGDDPSRGSPSVSGVGPLASPDDPTPG